jgi:hypothetical protein
LNWLAFLRLWRSYLVILLPAEDVKTQRKTAQIDRQTDGEQIMAMSVQHSVVVNVPTYKV